MSASAGYGNIRAKLESRVVGLEKNMVSLKSDSALILTELAKLNTLLSDFESNKALLSPNSAASSHVWDGVNKANPDTWNGCKAEPIITEGEDSKFRNSEALNSRPGGFSIDTDKSVKFDMENFKGSFKRAESATITADVVLYNENPQHLVTPCGPMNEIELKHNGVAVGRTDSFKKRRASFLEFGQSCPEESEDEEPESTVDRKSETEHHSRGGSRFAKALRFYFGISKPDLATNDPGSRAIHPSSPFMAVVELMSATLLVYSVGIVPIQLSLWSGYGACQKVPSLELDMFVDLFFLVEVCTRFFVGVEVNGKYCDDLKTIARTYSMTPFGVWFDGITSIPLSWVDWDVYRKCIAEGESEGIDPNASFIRAVKTLRIFKLSRLLKVFKFFNVIEERLDISPGSIRIVKVIFSLATAMHLYSCAFWRVKLETFDSDTVLAWLEARDVDPQDDGQIYVVCLYFICTVFTTVGFGDISASNHSERIFCIFMLCTAACFFALILSELQEIYASANAKSRDLITHLESVIVFLRDNRVPPKLEKQIKHWIRFQYVQQKADAESQSIMDNLPPVLRQHLASEINKGLFSRVPFWSRISNAGSLKDRFTAQLLLRMQTTFYTAGSCIARNEEQAVGIRIILSGRVTLYLPGRDVALLTIGPGSSMGDNTIFGDPRWAGMYGVDADFVAEEHCKTCLILYEDFQDVMLSSPSFIMIRCLVGRFRYVKWDDDDVSQETSDRQSSKGLKKSWSRHALPSETTADRDARHRKMKRQKWSDFHWIRLARIQLHLLRVRPGTGIGWSTDWPDDYHQIPLNVPSSSFK